MSAAHPSIGDLEALHFAALDNLRIILPPLSEEESDWLNTGHLAFYWINGDSCTEVIPMEDCRYYMYRVLNVEEGFEEYSKRGIALYGFFATSFFESIQQQRVVLCYHDGAVAGYFNDTKPLLLETAKFHPACLDLPKMSKEEFACLCQSIRERGFDPRHPILLLNGRILDGRHRYLACQVEGVEPQYTDFVGEDPYYFVGVEHAARRSFLSDVQKYLVISHLFEKSDEWAKEAERARSAANEKRSTAMKGGVADQVDPRPKDGSLAKMKAEQLQISVGDVKRAEYILRHAPDLAAQVAAQTMTATEALREAKRRNGTATPESEQAKKVDLLRRQLAAAEAALLAMNGGAS